MPVENTKQIGITLSHAPYGKNLAHEAIDAILAFGAYDQNITLIFTGDGVLQLLPEQNAAAIEQKSIAKQLSAFALYGIESIYACEKSLADRGLNSQQLATAVSVITPDAIGKLLRQQDQLLSF